MDNAPEATADSEDGVQNSDSSDSGIYDKEIKALQKTLQHLGVDEGGGGVGKTCDPVEQEQEEEEEDEEEEELSDDFVPTHLVSVSPARHTSRRRSDPGRVTLLHTRSPFGSSDSSEDDDMPERSPRSRSPRRFFGMVPEDDCYPAGLDMKNVPGWASPRRRVYRQGQAAIGHTDEVPRRGRTRRSNSLPLPDRAALGFGEAIGALATHASARQEPSAARQPPLKRNRCISIDEPALEAIMEENMVTALQKQHKAGIRRFSVPTARPLRRVPLPQKISP